MKRLAFSLFVSIILIAVSKSYGSIYKIYPREDTFVSSLHDWADLNFGWATSLRVEWDAEVGHVINPKESQSHAYFQIPLPILKSDEVVISATFFTFLGGGFYSGGGGLNQINDLYRVEDDSWDEYSITWNNKPLINTMLSSYHATHFSTWVMWDLSHLNFSTDLLDGSLSLAIVPRELSYSNTEFISKESGNEYVRPYLQIETTIIPEPTTIILMSSGLLVLLSIVIKQQRKGKQYTS